MTHRSLASACAGLLLLLAACAKTASEADAAKPTAEVTTAVLVAGALDQTLTAYGAVEFAPGAERSLSAPIEARVAQVTAGAGSPVAAGQTLVVLTPSPQSQIDLAKATEDARTARQAFERATRLQASGLDSNADLETARATNVAAQATLRSLAARAAGLVVKSPVGGVVETLTAAPGDLVAAGASLGKVGQLSAVRLRLGVDPATAARLRVGLAVRLQAAAGGPVRLGAIRGVNPQLDPQTRMAAVFIDAPGAAFAPGQPVRGDIVLGVAGGPLAPRAAVYYDQDQAYVLVVTAGTAHRRDVTLGGGAGEQVVIAKGAAAGERIVVEGGASLDDGTAVREAAPAAPEAARP